MSEVLASVSQAALCTVQDGGRRGFAAVGVPRSGAWHRERYLLAAALVSGRLDDRVPALEMLAGHLEFRMAADTGLAVVGPAEVACDGRVMPTGAVVVAESGSRWSIRWQGPGPVYVTVSGWRAPTVLGSAATDTFSRLGGEVVSAGTVLRGRPSAAWPDRVGAFHRSLADERGPLRILRAGDGRVAEFAAASWKVSSTSRSGLRLEAAHLAGSASVASSPTISGAVQMTPSGEAIILGPDGGITGGYPVLGVVAAADRDRLSVLGPGDEATFRLIDVDEAARARQESRDRMQRLLAHVHQLG